LGGETGWNSGSFGYLLSSAREIYVLNMDATLASKGTPPTTPVENTFRDENTSPLGQRGGPLVPVMPARNLSVTNVPLPLRVPVNNALLDGARLEGVAPPNSPSNVTSNLQWAKFPDEKVANSQAWVVIWEGVLPGTEQSKGVPLAPGEAGPAGGVRDKSQEFCQAGVVPGDLVLFRGCTLDTDCSVDGTSTCRQGVPGTPGLCFPAARAKDPEVLAQCSRLLLSRRRYEVVKSTNRRLDLALKPDERPRTALDRCTSSADCNSTPFEGFDCLQVRENEPKRCVKPCNPTAQPDLCRAGTVCEQIPGTLTGPLCVEGPPIVPGCWPLGAPYEVQAGKTFVVSGALAPRPPTARQENEVCIPDEGRNPLLVNRIPLEAPHCVGVEDTNSDNTVDLVSRPPPVPSGPPGKWGNPCLFWGVNDDDACARRLVDTDKPDPNDPTGMKKLRELQRADECRDACRIENGARKPTCHVKALFQNSQLQLILTNLEQYTGDANASRFDVIGGFRPEAVRPRDDIIVTMGVRILTGPTAIVDSSDGFIPYVFVVDQGRTASSGGGRGQVLRFNPQAPRAGYPQFDSNYSAYPFQIQ
jgi:hypothetical protein